MVKLRKYNVGNLYIGYLGIVRRTESGYICDYSHLKRNIMILTKVKYFDNIYQDIRTKTEYKNFHNIYIVLENEIGHVLYYNLIPLATHISKEKISWKEIEILENKLNNPISEVEEKEDSKELPDSTNVPFLDVLLTYKDNIEEINYEEKREELKAKVVELGRFYADTLMKIKLNMQLPTGLTLENPEESLKQLMTKELAKIDQEITMELHNNTLRNGVKILERSLGCDNK